MAGRLTGAGAPDQIPITPAVSGFIEQGVPNVAKRVAATSKAMQQLEDTLAGRLPNEQIDEVLATAQKYPRVMAHVKNVKGKKTITLPNRREAMGTNDMAYGAGGFGARPAFSDITLAYEDPSVMPQTFFHELGHAAQRVGLKSNMQDAYREANQAVGYDINPFELAAESISRRKMGSPEAPVTVQNSSPLVRAILSLRRTSMPGLPR
jgi:hypothetical protein